MALKLSSVTDHGIGYIVLHNVLFCFSENPSKLSKPKLRQFRPLDGTLTSFCATGKVCTEKAQSHLSHNQQAAQGQRSLT